MEPNPYIYSMEFKGHQILFASNHKGSSDLTITLYLPDKKKLIDQVYIDKLSDVVSALKNFEKKINDQIENDPT